MTASNDNRQPSNGNGRGSRRIRLHYYYYYCAPCDTVDLFIRLPYSPSIPTILPMKYAYRASPFVAIVSSSILRRSSGLCTTSSIWKPRVGSLSRVFRCMSSTSSPSSRLFEENLNIIFDSKCNVCKLEIEFLARRDARVNNPTRQLKMTDLESPDYDPNDPANANISYAQGMTSMHAVTADGKVLSGVPVFRIAYENVGLGWLFTITTWPVVKTIVDWGYDLFAKYRTKITRNTSLDDLIQAYEEHQRLKKRGSGDDCDVCRTKFP